MHEDANQQTPFVQVLFAEMHWIGSKEANPSEAPLEMPQELQTPILRNSATGGSHTAFYVSYHLPLICPSCCTCV